MPRRRLKVISAAVLAGGVLFSSGPAAVAAGGALNSIAINTQTVHADGSRWINAADNAGAIRVSGGFTPASSGTEVFVVLVAYDPATETCDEANPRKTEIRRADLSFGLPAAGDETYAVLFDRPDRIGFSDGDRVCAIGYLTSDGSGTSRLETTQNPTIDTQIEAGTLTLDAAGDAVDTDGSAATTGDLVDWINAAEALAAPGTATAVAPADGGVDHVAATVDFNPEDSTRDPSCTGSLSDLGGTSTVDLTPECVATLTDGGPVVVAARYEDRAGNSVTATSEGGVPVRLDLTAPASASLVVDGADIAGRNVINETNEATLPLIFGDVEPKGTLTAELTDGTATVSTCPTDAASTCVPRAADEDVELTLDVSELADSPADVDSIEASVSVVDLAGNETVNDIGLVAFKDSTDVTAPDIVPLNAPTVDGEFVVGDRLSLRLTKPVQGSEDAAFELTIGDASSVTPDVKASGTLTDGDVFVPNIRVDALDAGLLSLDVTVRDAWGNVETTEVDGVYRRVPPTSGIRILAPKHGAVVGPETELAGTIGLNIPSVQANLDGRVTTLAVSGGTFGELLADLAPGDELTGGSHTLRVSAPGTATVASVFTVDDSAPDAATVDQVTAGPLVIAPDGTLSGSLTDLDVDGFGADDAAGVEATVVGPFGNSSTIEATVDGDSWTIELLPGAAGPYRVTLTTLDEAGNETASEEVVVLALHDQVPTPPDPSTLPVPDPSSVPVPDPSSVPVPDPSTVPVPEPTPPTVPTEVPSPFAGPRVASR